MNRAEVLFLQSREGQLLIRLRDAGAPEPKRQFEFAPPRKFRFDLAYPENKIGIEYDGSSCFNPRRESSIALSVLARDAFRKTTNPHFLDRLPNA